MLHAERGGQRRRGVGNVEAYLNFGERAYVPNQKVQACCTRSVAAIDFVIEAEPNQTDSIIRSFQKLPQSEFVVQESLIRDAIAKKYMFNVLHLPTMLKLDFFLLKTNDDFDITRFQRKKTVRLFEQEMTFASPEDTILKKLLWYKESKIEKHLIDAAFVYQIQKDKLDKNYLSNWARKQKTTKLLKEIAVIDLQLYY